MSLNGERRARSSGSTIDRAGASVRCYVIGNADPCGVVRSSGRCRDSCGGGNIGSTRGSNSGSAHDGATASAWTTGSRSGKYRAT